MNLGTPNDANETLQLTASATVPTTFMRLFGFDDITVAAATEVTREVTRKMKALDVVLSMDISGSMGSSVSGGGTRLKAAQTAAKDLIQILFGLDTSKSLLKMGVVPWSSKVNVTVDGPPFKPANTIAEAVPSFINPETGLSQSVIYRVNNSPVPLLAAPPAGWADCVFNRYRPNTTDDDDADIRRGIGYSGGGVGWPG